MDNQPRKHFISLQASISLGMIALGILTSLIVGTFYYYDIRNQAREEIKLRLTNIIDMIALQLNPQELAAVKDKEDIENEFYTEYQAELSGIIRSNDDLVYIYTMRQDKDGTIRFYLDAGEEDYVPSGPGEIPYENPTDLLLATFASPSGTVVEEDLYTDEFGTFISAYTPIFNQDGSLESILGVDMKADTVTTAEQNTMRKIWIYFGISLPLIILLSWFLGYRLSRPAIALMAVATRIARITEYNPEPIPSASAGNSREAFELIQVFNRMSGELNDLIQNVDRRVMELDERSRELAISQEASARRARQFEAVSELASSVASVRSLDELLPKITQVISKEFNVYHVGIFLTDESKQFAVLSAANSPGGQRMLARGHRLQIGAQGIVGYVTATGNPRVAMDTGADAVFFNNPDLPDTRSEMALPLMIAHKVIGALDVQSVEHNAFRPEDIDVLSILAIQVSIAIQNARSLLETRRMLAESQAVMASYIGEAWKVLRPTSISTGYQKLGVDIKPLEHKLEGEHISEAVEHGRTVAASSKLAIPVRLRGQVIGVISLQIPEEKRWGTNEVQIAEAVAERLSLAIETATLIKATQRRANIERITADITGQIGLSTHLETILQTAAEQLSRALGGSDVLVQIEPVAMKLSSSS